MSKQAEVYYSTNEEDYRFSEMKEALEDIWDSSDYESETLTIWRGDCHQHSASFFVPDVLEHMGERAYDECGEYGENWPDLKAGEGRELQGLIEALVDGWFTKSKAHPTFGMIDNTKELNFKIVKQAKYFDDVVLEPLTP